MSGSPLACEADNSAPLLLWVCYFLGEGVGETASGVVFDGAEGGAFKNQKKVQSPREVSLTPFMIPGMVVFSALG